LSEGTPRRAVSIVRWALGLIACSSAAHAANCALTVEANDVIQFNARAMQVDPKCSAVELTLKHVGRQEAHVLGHDWVLAKSSDVAALVNAGIAAGFEHGYVPPGDRRVIAATKIVGGGEAATISFSTAGLEPGGDYVFFCSYPGHTSMMRGRFQFGSKERLASSREYRHPANSSWGDDGPDSCLRLYCHRAPRPHSSPALRR
jgi:azurin